MSGHRAVFPKDAQDFSPASIPILRQAVHDLSWLLTRSYAVESSLKLVGDRYQLRKRQRLVVRRAACSDGAVAARARRMYPLESMAGSVLFIDGFNILITVESLLSGALVYRCRDGCYRDAGSIHGTYRTVEETEAAIEAIGGLLEAAGVAAATWVLDRPVSNSGRLRNRIETMARGRGWNWTVELHNNPDAVLARAASPVASSDSMVLDRCTNWFNLVEALIRRDRDRGWVIDLSRPSDSATQA